MRRQLAGPHIVPTRVGVDRLCRTSPCTGQHRPHACGGGPPVRNLLWGNFQSSPRVWGWTACQGGPAGRQGIVPTRVGVDRARLPRARRGSHRPHACGGGPQHEHAWPHALPSSPRVWGWTEQDDATADGGHIVPTRVGVDRRRGCRPGRGTNRPHACGGGPLAANNKEEKVASSPRVWGWTAGPEGQPEHPTIVPTRVGVDRRTSRPPRPSVPSSPRVWGWTGPPAPGGDDLRIVPTRVGVDRLLCPCGRVAGHRPHACGGGPVETEAMVLAD